MARPSQIVRIGNVELEVSEALHLLLHLGMTTNQAMMRIALGLGVGPFAAGAK